MYFNFGFVFVVGFIVFVFGWMQYEEEIYILDDVFELLDEIEVEFLCMVEFLFLLFLLLLLVIEEVLDEEIFEDEEVIFEDQFIDDQMIVEVFVVDDVFLFLLLLLFLLFKLKVEEIFKVVEDMFCFFGCEDFFIKEECKQCVDKKMFEFIYKNIKYLVIVWENGVEGIVVVQFVVEKDGFIIDVNVVCDFGV